MSIDTNKNEILYFPILVKFSCNQMLDKDVVVHQDLHSDVIMKIVNYEYCGKDHPYNPSLGDMYQIKFLKFQNGTHILYEMVVNLNQLKQLLFGTLWTSVSKESFYKHFYIWFSFSKIWKPYRLCSKNIKVFENIKILNTPSLKYIPSKYPVSLKSARWPKEFCEKVNIATWNKYGGEGKVILFSDSSEKVLEFSDTSILENYNFQNNLKNMSNNVKYDPTAIHFEEELEKSVLESQRYIQYNVVNHKSSSFQLKLFDAEYIHLSRVFEAYFPQIIQGSYFDKDKNCYMILIKYSTFGNVLKECLYADYLPIPTLFAIKQYFINANKFEKLPQWVNTVLNYPVTPDIWNPKSYTKKTFNIEETYKLFEYWIEKKDLLQCPPPVKEHGQVIQKASNVDYVWIWKRLKNYWMEHLQLDEKTTDFYFSPRTIVIFRHILTKIIHNIQRNKNKYEEEDNHSADEEELIEIIE